MKKLDQQQKEQIRSLVNHPGWKLFWGYVEEIRGLIANTLLSYGQTPDIERVRFWQGQTEALRQIEKKIEEWKKSDKED